MPAYSAESRQNSVENQTNLFVFVIKALSTSAKYSFMMRLYHQDAFDRIVYRATEKKEIISPSSVTP